MSYDVIRHANINSREVIKFMKVIPGAVYFQSVKGNRQVVSSFRDELNSDRANGRDIYEHLRKDTIGRGYKITTDELLKAAKAYTDQFSSVKHSDDPDTLTDDDVEIIEAPYPENGKAQIPKRSFIYDDEDGYPQDYFEHHGILGMKWGVRRYQNPDGSLTEAGRKHYNVKATRAQLENATSDREKRLILTKSSNKSVTDLILSVFGEYGGIAATAILGEALMTPVAAIPIAITTANLARSFIYNTYKEMKLSELAAEFDVTTNVTRSVDEDKKK